MKKLFFMTMLMLALAVPMASGGTYSGGGSIGDYCHITGSPLTLNLGAPPDVGPVTTPGVGVLNANIPCTITCAIEAGGIFDRVVGQNTGYSMAASIAWDGVGSQSKGVAPPQINTPHGFTITVTRSGYADLSDSYSCTIILDTIP